MMHALLRLPTLRFNLGSDAVLCLTPNYFTVVQLPPCADACGTFATVENAPQRGADARSTT